MVSMTKRDIVNKIMRQFSNKFKDLKFQFKITYNRGSLSLLDDTFKDFINNLGAETAKKMHNVLMGAYGTYKSYGFISRKPETEKYYRRYADPYIPEAMYFSGAAERAIKRIARGGIGRSSDVSWSSSISPIDIGQVSANIGKVSVITERLSTTGKGELKVSIDYIVQWDKSGKRPLKLATLGEFLIDSKRIIVKSWDDAK